MMLMMMFSTLLAHFPEILPVVPNQAAEKIHLDVEKQTSTV